MDAEFRLVRLGDVPPRLVEETVRFATGDVSLVGTLVRPAGHGPWPAIVWVHGSGRQSRNEDFYRDRAYLVARHGVAALVYDKRGVGESRTNSAWEAWTADNRLQRTVRCVARR